MKAAVFKKEKVLVVEDVPEPAVADDDVLVKMKYCAICGSDLHRYAFGMLRPGTVMGHEYFGEVVDLGKSVEGFKVGDRVARWGGKIIPGRDLPNFPPPVQRQGEGVFAAEAGGLCGVHGCEIGERGQGPRGDFRS